MKAEEEYNKMNWLYNALYGDMSADDIKNLDFVTVHMSLLSFYKKESISIIDSACGNGIQATALALHGFNVTATDISSEMVLLADSFAKKHGVTLNTARKAWNELPDAYKKQFDIVFCTGNSIVHSPDSISREDNLKSLKQLLKNGGTLVIETRNWDKVLCENKRFTVYKELSYQNKEYIPLYHWMLNGMEEASKVEIIFQEIDKDKSIKLYESELTFTPFTHQSLLAMLQNMDLKIIQDTFDMNNDWYFLYAQLSNVDK